MMGRGGGAFENSQDPTTLISKLNMPLDHNPKRYIPKCWNSGKRQCSCKVLSREARGLVSKETVVLRRWGRETQNFEFIN